MQTQEVEIDGPAGRIAVADHGGDGPDVLLVHGANRTLLDWEPLRRHLPEARLVAYDLRGHGRSDAPSDGDYGWDAHLADLDAVAETLKLPDPYVVGHSLGGMIAVSHGHRRPGCPGVVDLDGFGGGDPGLYPGVTPQEVVRRRAAQLAGLAAAPAVLSEEQVAALTAQVRQRAQAMGVDAALEEAATRRALALDGPSSWRRKPGPGDLAALLTPLDGWNVFSVLRQVRCPVLLVQAGQLPPLAQLPDEFRELSEALVAGIERELAALSGPALVRLPDAGHLLHLQAPADVAGLIRTFLKS
ncbi:alpha/beta fold hydrolase [Nonomuraea zeae]|uniref:Alpha/beta hydrolase n=1 Tax=Nonomuraea zeae TaxID=1642303 RepID=A0A5S4GIE2_9ACTN|nr:alpha/beta hydrolase [Nonomuraea zeae]TMR32482.1 alpha/beta hydrolase [Nonomuraea zeae]